MAINRPTTKTIISTNGWGIPITDQVNANTTDVAALKAVVPWINLTLVNGWQAAAPTMTPQYRKIGDNIQMRGSITGGATGSTIATLPVGYRPFQEFHIPSMGFNGASWVTVAVVLMQTGIMSFHASNPAAANTYVPLVTLFSISA